MIKFKCILLVWVIAMLITGYHGTSLNNAHNILNEGKFKISNTDTEWLGSGIYFYYDRGQGNIPGYSSPQNCYP